jgi:putative flippase GtrA
MPGTSDTLTQMPAEDTTTAAVIELPFHHRVRLGVRKGHNWLQLIRFGVVGASGYAVNLGVFAILVHLLGVHYLIASPIAYVAGTINNFIWNRHWTFTNAREGHPGHQAWKFFAVSALSFGVNYGVLIALVHSTGMEKVLAQAIANIVGMPVNFLGQKLWSFKQ